MRKILCIALGLMAFCTSAMDLPDHVSVVNFEKITINPQTIFDGQVVLVENYVVSDFVLELKNPTQLQTFKYLADVNVIESQGFYKPILYENYSKITSIADYYIYKAKEKPRNEINVDTEFRIQNIPRKYLLLF